MRAFLLLVVVLALQFVPGVGVGDVQAQTEGEAIAACLAHAALSEGLRDGCKGPLDVVGSSGRYQFGNNCSGIPADKDGKLWWPSAGFGTCGSGTAYFYFSSMCPGGPNYDLGACNPSSSECLARNAQSGFKGVGDITRPWEEACVAGCKFKVVPPYAVVKAGSSAVVNGSFEFNGDGCSATSPSPADPLEQIPTPMLTETEATEPPIAECWGVNGVTICVNKEGKTCYPALPGSGRGICWRPGETGEKVDGPILQKRVGGVVVGTPGKTPPYGAMWEPAANGVEIMAEYGGFRKEGSGTAPVPTFTTTTQNFQTNTGVNAGGDAPDDGENMDGSPGSSMGNKGDDNSIDVGGTGSVSGGVNCDEPPIVTGEPLLANIILQTWGTRCALESENAVLSTGDVGDCNSTFTVEGPDSDPNVQKLVALRIQICGLDENGNGMSDSYEHTAPTRDEGIATGDTNDDGTGGGVVPGDAFGEPVAGDTAGMDWAGWGYTRTCPSLPSITLPGGSAVMFSSVALCDLMQTFGYLMLLLSSLFSLRIMAGGVG